MEDGRWLNNKILNPQFLPPPLSACFVFLSPIAKIADKLQCQTLQMLRVVVVLTIERSNGSPLA
jgi:hypothetical protein